MTPSQIISFVRDQTSVTQDQIDDSSMYRYMNIVYTQLWQRVAQIDKNYGQSIWKTDLVAGPNQYDLMPVMQAPSQDFWQYKIDSVTVQYAEWLQYPIRLKRRDWNNLYESPEFFEDMQNWSLHEAFYILSNFTLYLFPKPDVSIPQGITLYGTKRPYDLTSSMSEEDILLEREYHDIIGEWMFQYVYQERQLIDLKNNSRAEYEQKVKTMLTNLKMRITNPVVGTTTTRNYDQFIWPDYNYYRNWY